MQTEGQSIGVEDRGERCGTMRRNPLIGRWRLGIIKYVYNLNMFILG